MSTLGVGVFLIWNREGGSGTLALGMAVCGAESSPYMIFPCFAQSVQTVSLAPSIITLNGLLKIFRPQTSHRNWEFTRLTVFIILVVFIVVELHKH